MALKVEEIAPRKEQNSDEETKVMARPMVLQLIDSSLGKLLLCLCWFINLQGEGQWATEDREDKPRNPDLSLSGEDAQRFGGRRDCHAAWGSHVLGPRPHSLSWEKPGGSSGPPPTMFLEGKAEARSACSSQEGISV